MMAGATARLALPYCTPDDQVDVPRDVKALADKLDPLVATDADLDALAVALAAPALVTSLPASPADGTEVYFVASASLGVIWHLRFRAAAPGLYKWECVGAPRLQSVVGGNADTTGTGSAWSPTLTDGTGIVKWNALLAGDYEIDAICTAKPTTDASARNMSMGINVTGGTPPIVGTAGEQSGNHFVQINANGRLNGVLAGQAINMYYLYSPIVQSFTSRWFWARPIRVG